jgi:FkbM family methyltransferase
MKIFGMTLTGLIRRTKNGINKHAARAYCQFFIPIQNNYSIKILGSGEGQWPILDNHLDSDSICYCVGVGTNATFDIALANMGCEVHSFDPTPMALKYSEKHLERKGVHFHPIGVWENSKTLRFYTSSNKSYANYSTKDIHGTEEYIEAKCHSIDEILNELNHDHIDLLKLDIEGSWLKVLLDMLSKGITPKQLCVEYDTPTSILKIIRISKILKNSGYILVWRDRDNHLYKLNR